MIFSFFLSFMVVGQLIFCRDLVRYARYMYDFSCYLSYVGWVIYWYVEIANLVGYDGLTGVDRSHLFGMRFDGMMGKCMVTWLSWLGAVGSFGWCCW